MNKIIIHAVECISENPQFFYRELTANDVGANGAHQAGIYVHKDYGKSIFPKDFKKGENVHADIIIKWFDSGIEDKCKFIYYGKARRTDEFRFTCISRKFGVGNHLLIIKTTDEFIGFIFDDGQDSLFRQQLVKLNP